MKEVILREGINRFVENKKPNTRWVIAIPLYKGEEINGLCRSKYMNEFIEDYVNSDEKSFDLVIGVRSYQYEEYSKLFPKVKFIPLDNAVNITITRKEIFRWVKDNNYDHFIVIDDDIQSLNFQFEHDNKFKMRNVIDKVRWFNALLSVCEDVFTANDDAFSFRIPLRHDYFIVDSMRKRSFVGGGLGIYRVDRHDLSYYVEYFYKGKWVSEDRVMCTEAMRRGYFCFLLSGMGFSFTHPHLRKDSKIDLSYIDNDLHSSEILGVTDHVNIHLRGKNLIEKWVDTNALWRDYPTFNTPKHKYNRKIHLGSEIE